MARWRAWALAAGSGFVALSYELIWYRVVSMASSAVASAFGLLLGFYLLGLANGAWRTRAWCDRQSQEQVAARLAPTLGAAALVAFAVAPLTGWLATVGAWPVGLLAVGAAATLFGMQLPMVSHASVRADARAGEGLSHIYVANIVGSTAGSILTGFVLLDALPLRAVSALLLVLSVGLVAVGAGAAPGRRRADAAVAGALVAAALATPLLYRRLYEHLVLQRTADGYGDFVQVVENRHGVITVDRTGRVFGGGTYDGIFNVSLEDDSNGIIRAYAVDAIRPGARRVLMVGLGSGSWAQVVASLPGERDLTVVEINPGYQQLLPHHPAVAGLLTDPRVHLVTDDARRWLLRHPDERFDAIVMNTTFHWRAHVSSLLSREAFELARAHLSPGGLLLFNSTESPEAMQTALAVFAHAMRVRNSIAASDAPVTFDGARMVRTASELRIAGEPVIDQSREPGRRALERLRAWVERRDPSDPRALEDEGTLRARLAGTPVVTDDNMLPEWKYGLVLPVPQ